MSSRRPATRAPLDPPPAENGSDRHSNSVVLGPRDRLVGSLYIEGDLRVVGSVDGALEATGDVEIDGGGRVKGPVTTRQKLVVGSEGSLLGDVRVARLVIADGATFSGNVSMGKAAITDPEPGETGSAANAASPAQLESLGEPVPTAPPPQLAAPPQADTRRKRR
ncbi:MAG TPA: polymer-forming cytoskeletal protein [Candidatus Dormibacteraeota bacterium]